MNNNRRLIVLYNGTYPGGMAMSNRLHLYCKGLKEEGLQLHIYSISSTYSHAVTDGYEGVPFTRIPINVKLRGIVHLLGSPFVNCHMFGRLIKMEVGKGDAVFLIGFGWLLMTHLSALVQSRGAKVIMEVNELNYSWKRFKTDPEIIRRVHRFCFLRITLKKADGVIVISEKLLNLIGTYIRQDAAVIKVPILCDEPEASYKEASYLLPTTKPFVFHAGTLTESKDGITIVFKAFAKSIKNITGSLDFVLTNNKALPSTWDKIMSIIRDNGLSDRVHFLGYLPSEEISFLRGRCYLAVINKPDTFQNRYNFSTRLAEYLMDGVPVITTPVGEASNYLTDGQNCLLVPPNDVDAIADAIEYLFNNPGKAAKLGRNGKVVAMEHFSYRRHALRLKEFIENL